MKNIIPQLLMNEAGETASGGGSKPQPDVTKVVEDNFKKLQEDLNKLNSRIEQVAKAAQPQRQAPVKKQEEDEDEALDTLILINPAKAVERIESRVFEKVNKTSTAKEEFQMKFSELSQEYPEIGNPQSELHTRAKEILESTRSSQWDSGALERAVLRAAAEKGVLAVQHRKKTAVEDEDNNEYLGGSSSSGERSREGSRRNKSDKLPAASVALAELMGMNVKDPKVLERLTKTYNERRGNWNKYK